MKWPLSWVFHQCSFKALFLFFVDLQRGVVWQSQSSPHPVFFQPWHPAQPAGLHVPTHGPVHALLSLQDGVWWGEYREGGRAGGSRKCHLTKGTPVRCGAIQHSLHQQQCHTGEERCEAWWDDQWWINYYKSIKYNMHVFPWWKERIDVGYFWQPCQSCQISQITSLPQRVLQSVQSILRPSIQTRDTQHPHI